MCDERVGGAEHGPIARRSALKLGAAAAAALAIAPHAMAELAQAPPKPANVLSPDAALARLLQGNGRYVEGVSRRHDFKHEREALAGGQNPFAAVLSCADSRIAPEYCFDTSRGDLFVCRVAGNFASDDIVASLEYAIQVLNTPLIMVLGHEACGAVSATIKSVKDGAALPGHMPKLVEAIAPAVKAAESAPGDLLTNATKQNILLTVEKLKTAAPILKSFAGENKIRVVGGIYELRTGRVRLVA